MAPDTNSECEYELKFGGLGRFQHDFNFALPGVTSRLGKQHFMASSLNPGFAADE